MLKILLRSVLLGLVFTAFIVTVGSAKQVWKPPDPCQGKYNKCMDTCDALPPGQAHEICKSQCGLRLINCNPSLKPSDATKVPPGTTQPPPRGQVGQDVNVGGNQVDGGTKLKDRIRQHTGNLGGAQQVQPSGDTPGTPTILRSKKR